MRGGQLNTLLLNAGLIDEIILTYLPVVFGKGMPLFAPAASESMVRATETKNDKNGFVQLNLLLRCELQRPIKAKTTRLTYRVVFGWQRTRCYRRKLTYR
ncbi:dihydrofolate reductase family protein [Pontibacter pudoricolor]|uniref:dihydrofolate reductase family protein n=1 Tax=Pontibacter pudoricolor TaxID=2694930 RepID=UPI001EE43099|nr:dihydrofolate reductase family protein [Pontibacter pudoricolor]